MTIIDIEKARVLKEKASMTLKDHGIHMKIPTVEIAFWINLLTYITHTTGHQVKHGVKVEDKKLLQKEYLILQDITDKILVFNGFHENENLKEITFILNYEELIILEGQLEQFRETCKYHDDEEYLNLTEKYLNTIFKVLEEEPEMVDTMIKLMIKEALAE
ncbi:hypothetical protein JOC85_003907 [Bacillus mesophilus]|uniref:Uncharacterized protein n=1 Tax=Bacillus mesophilus TaxID=1808955 RepID=A0A6M0QDF7_9BACI|nr:hypothetical protein [Bacillus mesophilus]MBM7663081.1 hypothetical protein [Bacillus mesophilus]NEY73600.1 hypothetical protein [Bacillus mesophilus]